MAFGDVLRGLGSVLNPAVAQEVAKEDEQNRGAQQQVGMLRLRQQMEQQTPEYQAKVEALNNEKSFRVAAAAAGGDPAKLAAAAAQFGKPEIAVTIYNQQETRQARLQQAHDALEARRSELEMKISDKALDREQKERFNTMMAEMKSQQLAMQGEIAKGQQELKKMQFTMQGDKDLVKKTQQLGTALEKSGLPEIDSVLGAVEDSLKKNPDLASYLAGPKSLLPDMVIGTDLAAGKQAFQKLFNITLKSRSGSAVTNQELERLKSEFAAGAFKTPAQLQKAVDQARNIIQKHYASVTAGFGNDALEAYNENIRGVGGRVVLEPQSGQGGNPPPPPAGFKLN
jgi:hypothetical protein